MMRCPGQLEPVPEKSPFLAQAESFLANRSSGPMTPKPASEAPVQSPSQGSGQDADELSQFDAETPIPADNVSMYSETPSTFEVGGNTYAEVDAEHRNIPSVVTFGGAPAAQDGDLIYLGGGLYASASNAAVKQSGSQKKPARLCPGRVRPGKAASVSGPAKLGTSDVLGGLGYKPVLRDEYGFKIEPDPDEATMEEEKKGKKKDTGPAPWRPGGLGKRPPLPEPEPRAKKSEYSDPSLQMPFGVPKRLDRGPDNIEGRMKARENLREAGASLFGRDGVLREIAQLQMPMPIPAREKSNGLPSHGGQRAEQRRLAKEARVQSLLEDAKEQERVAEMIGPKVVVEMAPAKERVRMRDNLPRIGKSPSAPLLSAAALGLGLPANADSVSPEEEETQKLRVACKIETLAFLNGYQQNLGKMTAEQKTALLAQLHQAKVKQAPGPSPQVPLAPAEQTGADGEEEAGYDSSPEDAPDQDEQQLHRGSEEHEPKKEDVFALVEEETSVHQRLHAMNENCNQAFVPKTFDFDAEDFDPGDF